jgi:hypothetical protein
MYLLDYSLAACTRHRYDSRIVVYGLWSMVYGLWSMVYGLWSMVYGLWSMVYGLWKYLRNAFLGFGHRYDSRIVVYGRWKYKLYIYF